MPETLAHTTISLEDYFYELPNERIAFHPLAERSESKLLIADVESTTILHRKFTDITEYIPPQALLVLNDTRVICARLPVQKLTGGAAEILLLSQIFPSIDPAQTLRAASPSRWKCIIGGKNIRQGDTLLVPSETATEAVILEKNGAEAVVELRWNHNISLAEILEKIGKIPLPPYIKREQEADDRERYQTVYAHEEGSVAAPTAGLHFTEEVLRLLSQKNVGIERVTLHVGAGTFKPIQTDSLAEHEMHEERVVISRKTVENLCNQTRRRHDGGGHSIVAVGTTSARTLESLYLFGVRLLRNIGESRRKKELRVDQWDGFQLRESGTMPTAVSAFSAVEEWMREHSLQSVAGETQLMIAPGYEFAVCDALITNFHQPHSTLILLVAAFLGKDLWKKTYSAALEKEYRFLSYGDSSLLLGKRRNHAGN